MVVRGMEVETAIAFQNFLSLYSKVSTCRLGRLIVSVTSMFTISTNACG